MNPLKKTFNPFILGLMAIFVVLSCSSDADDTSGTPGQASLRIKTGVNYSGSASRSAIAVSKFLLNLEEIELEFDDSSYPDYDSDDYDDYDESDDYNDDYDDYYDSYYDDGYVNSDDDLELRGPFELDILAGSTMVTFDVPEARFEELSFEFDENERSSSQLYEKTVLIEGDIAGTPFEFWYYFEAEVEIDYENSNETIDINSGLNTIIISFDLDEILSQVNLMQATDGNANGIIEINPEGTDGNGAIAQNFKNALMNSANLLDD